jgi:formate dehydrogenase major subunit
MKVRIDDIEVEAHEGQTIFEAARDAGIEIPVLCHSPGLEPVGVCRMCAVDVGERVKAAACVRKCEPGMEIRTATPELEGHRAILTELLMSDQPASSAETDLRESGLGDNALFALARRYDASGEQFPAGGARGDDSSSKVIGVDHQACILCDRCIRACDDVQSNEVIGRSGKGYDAKIAFDLDTPMGESTCVSCGECAAACPTGALVDRAVGLPLRPRGQLEQVDSVCPYCGVGCALTYHVDREKNAIIFAEGRESPGNEGRLCVKGRYGWDYAVHAQRLTKPLIRIESAYPKGALSRDVRGEGDGRRKPGGIVDDAEVLPAFREASWEDVGGLWEREMFERGGLPLPEARAGGLRHEQRRSLHASVSCVERRSASGIDRQRGRDDDLPRYRERRRRAACRHEHDLESPGRRDLLQASTQEGYEAHRGRPAT